MNAVPLASLSPAQQRLVRALLAAREAAQRRDAAEQRAPKAA